MAKTIKLPIETENLIIDEFENSDLNRLREIAFNINKQADEQSEKGFMPFYTFQVDKDTPNRDSEMSQKVANFIIRSHKEKDHDPRSTYRLAVRLKGGELIGNVTVDMLPFEENGKQVFGDLGYFIDPAHAKHGYATEAVRAVSHHFFKEYENMDITAHPDNLHSRKLIERIGGKQTGYKDSSSYGHGEPRAVFAVDREDFYRSCAFAKQMPNLLVVLAKRSEHKNV